VRLALSSVADERCKKFHQLSRHENVLISMFITKASKNIKINAWNLETREKV
jgi:hypothetical protein